MKKRQQKDLWLKCQSKNSAFVLLHLCCTGAYRGSLIFHVMKCQLSQRKARNLASSGLLQRNVKLNTL